MMRCSGRAMMLLTLIGCSSVAMANDGYRYECRLGEDIRTIEVAYLQRESGVPCEVRYTKDGKEVTLWNASYQADYCEAKAKELSQTLSNAGWSCDERRPENTEDNPLSEQ